MLTTTSPVVPTKGAPLGDPIGCRPTIRRYYEGSVGVRQLADGREAHVTWLYRNGTNVDVVVWIPGEERVIEDDIIRVHAARITERILVDLES